MDGSINLAFWIGLGLAIPLSIMGNLLTPFLLKIWELRSEKSRTKRFEEKRKEYQLLKHWVEHRDEYTDYQFGTIVKTTIINALAGGISALFNGFGSALYILPSFRVFYYILPSDVFANIFFVLSNVALVFAALFTMNIARQAWHYHKSIKDLDNYARNNGIT